MKERLIMFAKAKGLSIRQLENECGWAVSTIHKINLGMRSDNLAILAKKYPELNLRWLILGEGEMFERKEDKLNAITPEQQELLDEIFTQVKLLREICESNYRTIDALRKENIKLKGELKDDRGGEN